MAFLLRVELPDVPGSLGALATVLGEAGADIEAIEIVEHRPDGRALDDVLLELPPTTMPDALITACHQLEGVRVHWVSRYNAGASLSRDLEAVEAISLAPAHAIERLVALVPDTFRLDWAVVIAEPEGKPSLLHASATAPPLPADFAQWLSVDTPVLLDAHPEWDSTLLAACRGGSGGADDFVLVVGRHGGPAYLASELARINYLVALAASIQA